MDTKKDGGGCEKLSLQVGGVNRLRGASSGTHPVETHFIFLLIVAIRNNRSSSLSLPE